MKTPNVIDGLVVAILIAGGAALASLLLGSVFGKAALLHLVLPAATMFYLLYLLRRSGARIGRLVTLAAWSVASLSCWLLDVSLAQQALVQAGLIWLVRSLYFHDSLIAAALDGGLVTVGIAAGVWALVNTGSAVAALWCFFLLQSLFFWIPDLTGGRPAETRLHPQDHARFQVAHRVATDAVRQLTKP